MRPGPRGAAAVRRAAPPRGCEGAAADAPCPPALTGAQKRSLRAHAGRLAAAKKLTYVQVAEVRATVEVVDAQLARVELVRCKFTRAEKKADARAMAGQLASLTGAAVAEVLGHTALLYRPSAKRLISI